LLAYDVEYNSDIFDYEVADGLNCLAFGKVPGVFDPLIVAGGNCSITGLDKTAEERFWTVTGDNAQALTFSDWDEDQEDELVVGSDDFAIRVFKGEDMIFDTNESAKI
jgi:Bardet-Biedl syndrome 2 protein